MALTLLSRGFGDVQQILHSLCKGWVGPVVRVPAVDAVGPNAQTVALSNNFRAIIKYDVAIVCLAPLSLATVSAFFPGEADRGKGKLQILGFPFNLFFLVLPQKLNMCTSNPACLSFQRDLRLS